MTLYSTIFKKIVQAIRYRGCQIFFFFKKNIQLNYLIAFGLLFGGELILSQFGLSFGGVMAQIPAPETTSATDPLASMRDMAQMLDMMMKMLYLFVRPMLVVAGSSMDNNFIYGSILYLDAPLWKMRNMMKNFANFALGFLFLWSILKYIFFQEDRQGSEGSPFTIIKNALIGGVLIQMSWFLLGAILDVATILTYGIGGMPFVILKGTEIGDKQVLGVKSNINFTDQDLTSQDIEMHYTYAGKNYAPCEIKNGKVVGPYLNVLKVPPTPAFDTEVCVIGARPVMINDIKDKTMATPEWSSALNKAERKAREYMGNAGMTIYNLIEGSKGFVGPFTALYVSILDFGSINFSANASASSYVIEFLLKAAVAIALLIPLFGLTAVLIYRVVLLWLVIAFSPILILREFFFSGSGFSIFKGDSIKGIIGLIFMPVLGVFALSLSIIFLTVLREGMASPINDGLGSTRLEQALGVSKGATTVANQTCRNVFITEVCFTGKNNDFGGSIFLDFFSWIIVNLFGIGMMWVLFFAMMKFSEVTAPFTDALEMYARSFAKSIPIVPVPNSKGGMSVLGAGALQQLPNRITNVAYDLERRFSEPINKSDSGNTSTGSNVIMLQDKPYDLNTKEGREQFYNAAISINTDTYDKITDPTVQQQVIRTVQTRFDDLLREDKIDEAQRMLRTDMGEKFIKFLKEQKKTPSGQPLDYNINGKTYTITGTTKDDFTVKLNPSKSN